VLYATPGSQLARQKQAAESANTPPILGSDHPLSKQARQNQQQIPEAVPVSRLLIWPVAARLRWRVALQCSVSASPHSGWSV
jgi:hypothetical protein